jgi:hypothetical protein
LGIERYAERAEAARQAGFEVLLGDIAQPQQLPQPPSAACLVFVLTALPLRADRQAVLASLRGWLGPDGRVWIRDFERLRSGHAAPIGSTTLEAYQRRYEIGPDIAARLWGRAPNEWVDGTFVAFHRGSRHDQWLRFEEHRYTVEEFVAAVEADVVRVDFPACHLIADQILQEMGGCSVESISSELAESRSGVLLPVLDAVFQFTH